METWSEIWRGAIGNYCEAVTTRDPIAAFAELLAQYRADPMVFYERGEAFEYCGQFQAAIADYERATGFPAPQWKLVATHALERARTGKPDVSDERRYRAEALHRVHGFPALGLERMYAALSGIHGAGTQPKQTLAALRGVLESLVEGLLEGHGLPADRELKRRTSLLAEERVVSNKVRGMMDRLWDQCNALHHGAELRHDIHETIELFLQLLAELSRARLL